MKREREKDWDTSFEKISFDNICAFVGRDNKHAYKVPLVYYFATCTSNPSIMELQGLMFDIRGFMWEGLHLVTSTLVFFLEERGRCLH